MQNVKITIAHYCMWRDCKAVQSVSLYFDWKAERERKRETEAIAECALSRCPLIGQFVQLLPWLSVRWLCRYGDVITLTSPPLVACGGVSADEALKQSRENMLTQISGVGVGGCWKIQKIGESEIMGRSKNDIIENHSSASKFYH